MRGLNSTLRSRVTNPATEPARRPFIPIFKILRMYSSDSKAQIGFKLMFVGFQTYVFNYYITLTD